MNGGGEAMTEDPVAELFYPLYLWVLGEDNGIARKLESDLAEARFTENVEMYLARSMGYGVIAGTALWMVGLLLGFVLFGTGLISLEGPLLGVQVSPEMAELIDTLKVPAFIIISGVVLGAVGFFGTFGGLLAYPSMKAGEREREINKLLPDSISFMYALSVGGMNQLEILRAIANADETYGSVSEEFQSIILETEYFDTDYRSAIQKQSEETPSDHLSQFLMDMLSILDSGGDMEGFLEDKKDKHLRLAKQEQQQKLDTLELFGEMYMTLSLFPLLLIIILVAMSLLGDSEMGMMYGVVYGLLPLLAIAFLVLVSTVKEDETGTGELSLADEAKQTRVSDNVLHDSGLITDYQGEFDVFDEIREAEDTYNTLELLRRPHLFFRDNPMYVTVLTIPASLVIMAVAVTSGTVPTDLDGFTSNPVWPTFVYIYVPLYINFVPLAFFYEWNRYHRYSVVNDLSETLRKLASANESGQELFEAMKTVGESSDGKLAEEFEIMHAKIQYGTTINQALVEFNNKYKIPRLARTIKLISKAQEASNQITKVLTTAAQSSENQDDIARERKSNARMQVVIIIMTYLTLLAVMAILQTQFIEVMAQLVESTGGDGGNGGATEQAAGGADEFGAEIDVDGLSMLFFHAVTLQAIFSGVIAGYMRDAKILSGLKYSVILMSIALIVWMFVG